jgi:Protein of unknown function (DUF5818)
MLKTLMLTLTLLVSVAWLQAQQYPKTGSDQTGSTKSSQTKVEGCLQGSNGNFTLTDSSGTTYQLQGDTSKLAEHVGHEVLITGNASAPSAASASAGSAGAGSQTLDVKGLKHISKTCKSTGK